MLEAPIGLGSKEASTWLLPGLSMTYLDPFGTGHGDVGKIELISAVKGFRG